jgi:lipopolysaccharide/colanic/teichoic acid biosynthesis glycosyltransferase
MPGDEPLGKSVLDLLGAGVLLVLVLPVLAGLSALLWLSRPGPVLAHRDCAGPGGRRFSLLSFRQVADAEPLFVTRLLRESGLDQLPQLLNVLRGDMSLIGPRPRPAGAAGEVLLRPGLIGLPAAEVTGYFRTWSLGRDLAIIGAAARAGLGARRARR